MANRTFKKFVIVSGGTPQPLVGTYITATTVPSGKDPQGDAATNIPVNDSSMFKQGDRVLIQSVTYTVPEIAMIQKVPDSTHILVRNLQNTRTGGAFGTGDFVSLAIQVNRPYVQCTPGNAGLIYVGTAGLVKSTEVNVIATLQNFAAGTQPIEYSDSRNYTADPFNSSDLWCDGTTNDGYLPSFGVA
jgi:hypothetical protein